MAGLGLSSRPPVHPAFNPTFHYVLSSSSSALRLPLAVSCTTFRPGAESERQKELELKRKQKLQDGFSVLPQMWSKEDMRHEECERLVGQPTRATAGAIYSMETVECLGTAPVGAWRRMYRSFHFAGALVASLVAGECIVAFQ